MNTFLDLACQEATFQLATYFTSRPHKYLLDLDAISLHLSAFELQDLVFQDSYIRVDFVNSVFVKCIEMKKLHVLRFRPGV